MSAEDGAAESLASARVAPAQVGAPAASHGGEAKCRDGVGDQASTDAAPEDNTFGVKQEADTCTEWLRHQWFEVRRLKCSVEEYDPLKTYTPDDPFLIAVPYGPCLYKVLPFVPEHIIQAKKWKRIQERCAGLGITATMLTRLFQKLCSPVDEALGTVKLKRFFGQFAVENRRLLRALVMDIAKGRQRVYFEDAVLILSEFCALDFVSLVYKFAKVVGGDHAVYHMNVELVRGLLRYLTNDSMEPFCRMLLARLWSDHEYHKVQAFVDLCFRYPVLAYPLIRLQRSVQRKIFGQAFWQQFHSSQRTQLLPASFSSEHARMIAARVLMLEAVSEVCRPFQFGSITSVSTAPPRDMHVLDPAQWDFSSLPLGQERPPLTRTVSTSQMQVGRQLHTPVRASSLRSMPRASVSAPSGAQGALAVPTPRPRATSAASEVGVFTVQDGADPMAIGGEVALSARPRTGGTHVSSRPSTVLGPTEVQLGQASVVAKTQGIIVEDKRMRRMSAAERVRLGYDDPLRELQEGAEDAEVQEAERTGETEARSLVERKLHEQSDALAAELALAMKENGVLDLTAVKLDTLKDVLQDARIARELDDVARSKVVAEIFHRKVAAERETRPFLALQNTTAYVGAAFAFSYYQSLVTRNERKQREGAVDFYMPTNTHIPLIAGYARSHPAPHGARCVKSSMDIAQLVLVHAASGVGVSSGVVQAPCLFTGVLIAQGQRLIEPPPPSESIPDSKQHPPSARSAEALSTAGAEKEADPRTDVFSTPRASARSSHSTAPMRPPPAPGPVTASAARTEREKAKYLPSAHAAGKVWAALVNADGSLGEFETLERLRMQAAVARGERSSHIVIKFPMLCGAPPIRIKRPEVNDRILVRRCGVGCQRCCAYTSGWCEHACFNAQDNVAWCTSGECGKACQRLARAWGAACSKRCGVCAARVHLKARVWYARSLGRLTACLAACGESLCLATRSLCLIAQEVCMDCGLSVAATLEGCCGCGSCCKRRRPGNYKTPAPQAAASKDPDEALRAEVAALSEEVNVERRVDTVKAAALARGEGAGGKFAQLRRERERARARRMAPRGGFVAPRPRQLHPVDDHEDDNYVSVGPGAPGAGSRPKQQSASLRDQVGDAKETPHATQDLQQGEALRLPGKEADSPPASLSAGSSRDLGRLASSGGSSPARSPLRRRLSQASGRSLLTLDTTREREADQQAERLAAAEQAAADYKQAAEVRADMAQLEALSRAVSFVGQPGAEGEWGSKAQAADAQSESSATSSPGRRSVAGLRRVPSQLEVAEAQLSDVLGMAVEVPKTSTHTMESATGDTSVVDLGAALAAKQRAERLRSNPKAKPRSALYPATKVVVGASLPDESDLPPKTLNTGFSAQADYYMHHVLADLFGYKVAGMVLEAAAAPQGGDHAISAHESAARATGQGLVDFHRNGEREGYILKDDVWMELFDEETGAYFYANLATGQSTWQAPPDFKAYDEAGEV